MLVNGLLSLALKIDLYKGTIPCLFAQLLLYFGTNYRYMSKTVRLSTKSKLV